MNINWETKLYCLIGHPISKSLSPIIHNNFFQLNNLNSIYLAFDIDEREIKNTVHAFKAMNVQGFNVTIPYKIKIMDYLDEVSNEARLMGAVNTVKNENGKLIGYNTDGLGFLKSLEDKNIDIKNKNVLVLGAGGAANAICTALALAGVNTIYINNRDIDKGKKLAKKTKMQFSNIDINYGDLSLKNIIKEKIHMVINCTSVGMYPNIDQTPILLNGFSKDLIVYDIIYKPKKTKLLKFAEDKGYTTIGGLSMLINQGLCSQEIWLQNNNDIIYEKFDIIEEILNLK